MPSIVSNAVGKPRHMLNLPAGAYDVRVTPGDREGDPPKCVSYREPLDYVAKTLAVAKCLAEIRRIRGGERSEAETTRALKLARDLCSHDGKAQAEAEAAAGPGPGAAGQSEKPKQAVSVDPDTGVYGIDPHRALVDSKLGEPFEEFPLVKLGHAGADDEREVRPLDAGDFIITCCVGIAAIAGVIAGFFILSLLRGP